MSWNKADNFGPDVITLQLAKKAAVGGAGTTDSTARAAAAAAQTTANTANTNAGTAQTTANNAQTTANSAQTRANSLPARSVSAVSTPTTAGSTAATDYYYLVTGTTTLTLPTAVGNTNLYTIKNAGTNIVTIATTSSQTIDGSGTAAIQPNVTLVLISDNTNWRIL